MVRTASLEHAPFCGRRVVSIEPFYIVLPGGCLLFFSTAGLRWFYDVDGVAVTRCRVWPMLPVSQARETLLGWPLSKNIRKQDGPIDFIPIDVYLLNEWGGAEKAGGFKS